MGLLDRLRSAARAFFTPETLAEVRAPSPPPEASGEVRAAGARRDPRQAMQPQPLWLQNQRIGGNLTPLQVSDILREADTGRMARFQDLACESRERDCHLQSVLGTRELAVAGLPWQVLPGGTKKRDKKVAELCARHLRSLDDFPTLISHLAGGAYHGYAVAEQTWQKKGGYVLPTRFFPEPPRRFIFDQDNGQLRWWDSAGTIPYPGIDLKAAYPDRFIIYQPRVNGDVPSREGLARVLVWAALFRNWDLRDWLSLAELAWKPWRTGKYKKSSSSQEDIDALYDILEQMSASAVAVYPDSTEVEVHWPAGSGGTKSAHGELYGVLGGEMSKAALGQTLTTEQGDKGSHSLGKVHDRVRGDILEADARAIAAVIRRDILEPIVRRNFGADVEVPLFVFSTEETVDAKTFAEAIKTIREAGLKRIPAAWVRGKMGMPEPTGDEELLADPPAPAAPPAPGDGTPPEGGGKPDGEKPDDGEKPEEPKKCAPVRRLCAAVPPETPDEPPTPDAPEADRLRAAA